MKVFETTAGGGAGLDRHHPQHLARQQRVHGRVHAVPTQLRGRPDHVEPAQRRLRRWLRRLLRLPGPARRVAGERRLRGVRSSTSWTTEHERLHQQERRGRHRRRASASAPRSPRSSGATARSSSPSTPASRSTAARRAVAPRPRPRSGSSTPAGRRARRTSRSPTRTRSARCSPELVEEFGALDAVVNVAGISRPTGFASRGRGRLACGARRAPQRLPQRAPRRAAAHGRGRPRPDPRRHLGLGVAARRRRRVQLRQARRRRAHVADRAGDAARGHRERAVADRGDPHGARRALPPGGRRQPTGRDSATGGVSLGLASVPPPEHLGPIGAYLAGEDFASWARGQIVFSNGAEVAWVVPPRLLEVARTSDVGSLLAAARVARAEGPRAGRGRAGQQRRRQPPSRHRVRRRRAGDGGAHRRRRVPSSSPTYPRVRRTITTALAARGVECVTIDAAGDRASPPRRSSCGRGRASRVRSTRWSSPSRRRRARRRVRRPAGNGCSTSTPGSPSRSAPTPPGSARSSDYAAAADRPVRVVTVVDATTAGGRSRAQSATQLSPRRAPGDRRPGRRVRDRASRRRRRRAGRRRSSPTS